MGSRGNALGMGLGNFLSAFTGAKRDKEVQADKDKERKLQTQLFEIQLKKLQESEAAMGRVDARVNAPTGLVQGESEFSPGGRELTQFESAAPESLSELLADPSLLLDAQRAGIDFGSTGGDIPPDVRALMAAGIDPKGQEGREAILSSVSGTSDPMDQLLLTIQTQTQQTKLEEMRIAREKAEKTEAQRISGTKVAVRNDFGHAREIFELQKKLEGSALAVGLPYGDFLRDIQQGGTAFLEGAGMDLSETRELIADRDRLSKLFADGLIESVDRLSGTMTNQKLDALNRALPNITNSPSANELLIADRLQAVLDAAEIEEIDVAQRKEVEAFIKELRARPEQPAPTDGNKVGRFTVKEI